MSETTGKELSMEEMAEMSIEQIDAMASGGEIGGESQPDITTKQAEGTAEITTTESGGKQVVEDGGITMKSGKGIIPYGVLKGTREELAEAKRRLEALESKSYQSVVPENFADLTAQAAGKMQELIRQFDDAEISAEEFQAQLNILTTEKEFLLAARIKAEISEEMRAQAMQDAARESEVSWQNTVNEFFKEKPDGIDYASDPAKFSELDAAIKMFAANPANQTKDHQWFLDKAHREVLENNGIQVQQKTTTPPVDKKPAPISPSGDDTGKSPIFSLSDIPGGMVPDGGSEIEQAAALSGPALTNRFLNDPAQIDKMLAGLR